MVFAAICAQLVANGWYEPCIFTFTSSQPKWKKENQHVDPFWSELYQPNVLGGPGVTASRHGMEHLPQTRNQISGISSIAAGLG